ncbi:MAG: iron-sulfur cluster assembly scaffold protein [Candidatus Nealsonbacteria bacterium]|nr:iron-sulfur cluster assembly scaffold protein [Candidatus Nealsonbacteria bacterium]
MKSYYTKKAINHFIKPKNFGTLKGADGIGEVGNIKCGDLMKLYIKLEKGRIVDVKFHTLGCAAAIATSDVICEMAKGKTPEEALKITYEDIVKELGDLPKIKIHCATLAQEGLKSAIINYEKKKKKQDSSE